MSVKIVLMMAILAQLYASILALRLNQRYRWHSSWMLISGAAAGLSVLEFAVLMMVWDTQAEILDSFPVWTASLSALLVSVLFVGGVSMIEPLFVKINKAEYLMQQENERLERVVQHTEEDLALARHIQEKLLPAESPQLPGLQLAGSTVPAEWTNGDLFDFMPVHPDKQGLVIADATGHGTGPALLMTTTRAYLRVLSQRISDPAKILTAANRAIVADVDQGRFVTVFFAQLDPEQRTVDYASAGHEGYLLRQTGERVPLHGGGPPLGMLGDIEYETAPQVTLDTGDIILLASDGIPEAQPTGEDAFGVERMLEIVWACREKSAEEIVAALMEAVGKFIGPETRNDDMTVVLVKAV